MPPPLNARLQGHIDELFAEKDRDDAAALLADRCGTNLPLVRESDERTIERVRTAAVKVSEGSLEELRKAVQVALADWRDLLVAAGFGHDPLAHESWRPGGD